ncbi:MAG TPA: D-alanine--D-alanine ligase A [Chloroflexi bacterium]|nr:D-alanine--D-alanine ligase A [Chloroflexota bacterium]
MTTEKMRIGILFGGRSGEHEVSLRSTRSVLEAIDYDKYIVSLIGITKNGKWITGAKCLDELERGGESVNLFSNCLILPYSSKNSLVHFDGNVNNNNLDIIDFENLDVIFPILHGTNGEDGSIQGLLEIADLPYVGSGVLGSSVGMDKILFKTVMESHVLPVVPSYSFNRSVYLRKSNEIVAGILDRLDLPVFIKPANLGSSVGISMANDKDELISGIDEACKWDRRILVERRVDAREIEVSVLGNDEPQVSVAGEIVSNSDFYDYEAKYVSSSAELIIPASITQNQLRSVQEMALEAYKAIDCSGMARVDFLLDNVSGDLWVNELNTIPGFTSISMYPKLWQASGVEFSELIDILIELALERKIQRDSVHRSFEVLH